MIGFRKSVLYVPNFRKYTAEKSKRGRKGTKRKSGGDRIKLPCKRRVLRGDGGGGVAECDTLEEPPPVTLPKREPVLPLDEGPLAAIWKGKTKPLLQPRDASDTAAIMERIR